jgi:hypothetical protein
MRGPITESVSAGRRSVPSRSPGQLSAEPPQYPRRLDRALAPPLTLDDRRLEGLRPKLRHPQTVLAGLGLQLALVVPSPGVPACFAALIALCVAQPTRLGLQQRVQRLFHATSHHPVEVRLNSVIVNVMTLPNGLGVVSVMAVLLSLTWLRLATSSSPRSGGRQPYIFVRRIPYAIVITTFDHGGRRSI